MAKEPPKEDDRTIDHAEWLVKNRSETQNLTLELYKILETYKDTLLREREDRQIARMLAGICFAMWRSVFLTDISNQKVIMLGDTQRFISNLILHNTIGYTQDRNDRESTYLYYIDDAWLRFNYLKAKYKDVFTGIRGIPPTDATGSAKAQHYWESLHNSLVVVISNFRRRLEEKVKKSAPAKGAP